MMACNYDEDATFDDGSCIQIADGECDCDGNVLDDCGECGGSGVILEGDCDCDGNVLDDCGECGGDNSSCTGCMEELATNYDSDATISDDDSCCYLEITSASITYNDFGIGTGALTFGGQIGSITCIWLDGDSVEATNSDALAYSSYTVTVIDSNGCMETIDVTQTELNDIEPLAFGLFPNPTTGAITLQVSTEMDDVNMQVFDATGRVVFTQSNLIIQGSISLDFSNLSTGTYSMILSNNKGVSVRRLSIQH